MILSPAGYGQWWAEEDDDDGIMMMQKSVSLTSPINYRDVSHIHYMLHMDYVHS
jgi:hypothetical protein